MGPERVDFRAPDEEFGLEGTPKPKIQRGPSPKKETLYREVSVNRNTPQKQRLQNRPGMVGKLAENKRKTTKNHKTDRNSGTLPKGFCITAPTVCGPPL